MACGPGKNAKRTFCVDPGKSEVAVYTRSRPMGTDACLCVSTASFVACLKSSRSKLLANGARESKSKRRRVIPVLGRTKSQGSGGAKVRLRNS